MTIKQLRLLDLAAFASENSALLPNHCPDIPNRILKEIAECKEIIGYIEHDDPIFTARLRDEIKELEKANLVYEQYLAAV